jgi:hypothetical protein
MSKTTPGRRVDAAPGSGTGPGHPLLAFAPGDYGRDEAGEWYCRPPWKHAGGCLRKHRVVEHEDGTITVSPSILIECCVDAGSDPTRVSWHGWLERGQWREC